MNSDNQGTTHGIMLAADEDQAFWLLSNLTINKIGSGHSPGRLSILDHRVSGGFAPPPASKRPATRHSRPGR
jgi:hypothetical protein